MQSVNEKRTYEMGVNHLANDFPRKMDLSTNFFFLSSLSSRRE